MIAIIEGYVRPIAGIARLRYTGEMKRTDCTALYHLAKHLQRHGAKCCRVRLENDPGNLLSPGCFGIRAMAGKEKEFPFIVWNTQYCVRDKEHAKQNDGSRIVDFDVTNYFWREDMPEGMPEIFGTIGRR